MSPAVRLSVGQNQPDPSILAAAALEAIRPQDRVTYAAYHDDASQRKSNGGTVIKAKATWPPLTTFPF